MVISIRCGGGSRTDECTLGSDGSDGGGDGGGGGGSGSKDSIESGEGEGLSLSVLQIWTMCSTSVPTHYIHTRSATAVACALPLAMYG